MAVVSWWCYDVVVVSVWVESDGDGSDVVVCGCYDVVVVFVWVE